MICVSKACPAADGLLEKREVSLDLRLSIFIIHSHDGRGK